MSYEFSKFYLNLNHKIEMFQKKERKKSTSRIRFKRNLFFKTFMTFPGIAKFYVGDPSFLKHPVTQ